MAWQSWQGQLGSAFIMKLVNKEKTNYYFVFFINCSFFYLIIGIIYMITDKHTRWHKLNLNKLLLSTEQLSQLYSSLKQTYKTQPFVCKLSTKNMNKTNVTRRSPVFSCWEQSCWSILRWKFSFHCVCTLAPNHWVVRRPLLSATVTSEFSWRWNTFQQSGINGNVAAMRCNFLKLTNRVGVVINMPTMDVQDDWVDSSIICCYLFNLCYLFSEGWQDLFLYATNPTAHRTTLLHESW